MAYDGTVKIGIEGDDSGLKSTLSKIGGIASGVASAAMASIAVVSTAIVAVGTSAIKAYADYEQLVGGVDTLFKASSAAVQENAQNAFKTAGLSANEYMAAVTSFSASLLQSLAGDTDAAAKIADMAMVDMSDNANKMGSSMQSIQDAYQGFAKQNYTMLDNLKLGYGGTKTEMERLLADAEKLTGVQYDISNLSDVYEAIHAIQGELGITGTTALEASTTIQGSAASMKAAWENMLVGLADDTQDFDALLVNLIDSVGAFAENLIPRIEVTLGGIVKIADKLLPQIAEIFPKLATDLVPSIVDLGLNIVTTLVQGIVENAPLIAESAVQIALSLVTGLLEMLPTLADGAIQLVTALAQGIAQALPELIPAAVEAVTTIVQGLVDNLPLLIDAALQLIVGLVDGILNALPIILNAAPQIMESLIDGTIQAIPMLIDAALDIVTGLCDFLLENLDFVIESAIKIILAVSTGLIQAIPQLVDAAIQIVMKLVEYILSHLPEIIAMGGKIMLTIVDTLIREIPKLMKATSKLIKSITNPFKDFDWGELGKNIVDGLVNSLYNGINRVVNAAKDLARSAWEAAKDFLGIESPSKKFAYLGDMSVEGYENKLDAGRKAVAQSSAAMAQAGYDAVAEKHQYYADRAISGIDVNLTKSTSEGNAPPIQIIMQNEYHVADGMDVEMISRRQAAQIENALRSKGVLT